MFVNENVRQKKIHIGVECATVEIQEGKNTIIHFLDKSYNDRTKYIRSLTVYMYTQAEFTMLMLNV